MNALVEDIYPLSGMQRGMLFHTLYSSEARLYVHQLTGELRGALDIDAFRGAWADLVARHSILRTSFVWDGLEQPLQVVARSATLPLVVEDWRDLAAAAQHERWTSWLDADRVRPFDLARAPAMRVGLVRLADHHHRLLWTHHHMLLDGWSIPVALRELMDLYEARRSSTPAHLPPARPYRDWIAWLQRQNYSDAEQFWRRELPDTVRPTYLADALGRGDRRGDARHEVRELELDVDLTRRVTEWAQQHRVTTSTVVQAAWALLVSRYTGASDVLFGSVVSGRTADLPGIASMVGLFINTLPLRVRVDGAAPVDAWLRRVQQEQAEAREFAYAPLADIQTWTRAPHDRTIFDTVVVFENYPWNAVERTQAGLTLENLRGVGRTNYALTLVVRPLARLLFRLTYDAAVFSATAIDRMLGHVRQLLVAIVSGAGRVGALDILTERERTELVDVWNHETRAAAQPACAHALIERAARRTPDAVAVVCGSERLTYSELNQKASRLAARLRAHGVGPEVRVGLFLRRSLNMVVAVLGTLKAGGTYVPLDVGLPRDRLALMLDDASPLVVITEADFVDDLPRVAGDIILLDRSDSPRRDGVENVDVAAAPEAAAYVIYTSGSTGRPKGVVVEHRQIVNYVDAIRERGELTSSHTFAMVQPLAVDSSATVLYGALCAGACLHVVPEDAATDAVWLAEYFAREAIDCLKIAPSHLAALQQTAADPLRLLPRRTLIVGGEASRREWLARVREMAPNCAVFNHYGPTETTVGVLMHRFAAGGDDDTPTVPLGRPLLNVRVYVLDDAMRPVPVGVAGELYVGGAAVARGYLNRPDLTADRFVADPFSAPGARLYRTGDLARWRDDGEIEFLGRRDRQVKIRGFRVELPEVEAAVRAHPAVRDCVVDTRADHTDALRLVGYVVWRPGGVGDVHALRRDLQRQLPDYMVPAEWVSLERLPLTAHGKLDRRALPNPDGTAVAHRRDGAAPRTPTEEIVASIWADVLRRPSIDVGDDFFELGGHSLLAMQVISRIRQVLRLDVPIRRLFDRPTVRLLAESLDEDIRAAVGVAPPPIERLSTASDAPLSFAQERMLFLQQFDASCAHYNVSLASRLAGRLDPAALERALAGVVGRHDVLRTTYTFAGGRAAQDVGPVKGPEFSVIDLEGTPAAERVDRARDIISADVDRPFDLSTEPPVRAVLVRLDNDDHLFALTLHHIACDGWSMGILTRELSVLYAAEAAGAPSPLSELPIQYVDYAAWQRSWLRDEALEHELAYWRRQLDGAVPLEVPTDRTRPPVQRHRGGCESVVVPRATMIRLEQLSRSRGVTPFMVLLASWAVLLQRYAGQDDIVVGTPIAGRLQPDTEGLVGLFVNTLPLRINVSGAPRVHELLDRVKAAALGAYAHQQVPFEKIVEELQPARDMSRHPIVQVVFALQHTPEPALDLPGVAATPIAIDRRTAKFDLALVVAPSVTGDLTGTLEYDADLYEPATVGRLVRQWQRLLAEFAKDGGRRIDTLSIADEEERARLLSVSSEQAPRSPAVCLHHVFEARAAASPDAIALEYRAKRMSYGELNSRANQLARYLQERGIGPERHVALCTDRSPDLIVGLLGILKAGAAYVPIDPQYPIERLRHAIDDCQAAVVVTERAFADRFPSCRGRIIELDGDAPHIARFSDANLPAAAIPANAAYIIYTSGSTGQPKGCLVTHENVISLLHATERAFGFHERDAWTLFHSAAFDFSVWEIWGALAYGGRLVIADYWLSRAPSEFLDVVRSRGVTVLNQTPSAFWPLLREHEMNARTDVPLRAIIFGGEALDFRLLQPWYQRHPDTRPALVNMYGITETTVHVTYRAVQQADVEHGRTHRIGLPIPGVRLYLLDPCMRPVPMGVPGEIYVGGTGVARGYWRKPDLTADRFIPDCYAPTPGARMYRSGDRARWVERDGELDLEYLGRLDQQVKVRGFRIEPGEIEAALRRQPGVCDAIVISIDGAAHQRELAAYVVPAPRQPLDVSVLQQALKPELPAYMMPTAWAVIDRVPLNANGKLDRAALPRPAPPQSPEADDGPHDAVEIVVWGVWREVLGAERLARDSNFFDIGGHSIAAARVVARTNAQLHLKLGIRSLFEHTTPASFAAAVRDQLVRSAAAAPIDIA